MRTTSLALALAALGCHATEPESIPAAPAYSFVFLEDGARSSQLSEAEIHEASLGHRENIARLGEDGVLLLAGPFGEPREDDRWRGIFVFDEPDVERALELTATDPAVRAGALSMRVFPWRTRAPMGRARELERARADRGDDFRGRAYVLGTVRPGGAALPVLESLEAQGRVAFWGELGGAREGEVLFVLTAETPGEAREWIESVETNPAEWRLSSWYATEYLMELADAAAR
jgi:uncharacterized protein YciI